MSGPKCLLLGSLALSLFAVHFCAPRAQPQKLITPGYQFNSDPTCRELNGRFYLFTTHDPFTVQFETDNNYWAGMYDYHAYSTTDFDHWVDHGSILSTHDLAWHAGTALWDGDAGIPANGKFYAYVPARVTPDAQKNDGSFRLGVLVADKVEGPYKDALDHAMTTVDGKEIAGLSPTVIQDSKGNNYLVWGSDAVGPAFVRMARLAPDMVHLAEPAHEIAFPLRDDCGENEWLESPIPFERDGTWYLTYIATHYTAPKSCSGKTANGFYIRYVTSKSMFGPFDRDIQTLMLPSAGAVDNNHQGICSYKGKWYLAFHTHYDFAHRQVAVTEMHFRPDGTIETLQPDDDLGAGTPGVTELTLDAFAGKREAQEFNARMNADPEPRDHGGYHFKLKDGGYLRFDRVDFGSGARGIEAFVSAESAQLHDARLEIRLDNQAGELIGSIPIAPTGGAAKYVLLSANAKPVGGIHTVFLLARGRGGDTQGRLFNLAWFTFTEPNDRP
jgi:hypothetical protein